MGPKFRLKSGVPQGGILSPTLFIIYTADIPAPGNNCIDIAFADDITQVIQNLNNDRERLARDMEKEIQRINIFEKRWKIQTNLTKFGLLSISKKNPRQVTVDGRPINFKEEIKVLGLSIRRTGTVRHISNRINFAKQQTNKLKRFIKLETKTKLTLYKAMIRPILEYPIVPTALASKAQTRKMQRVQNKNLRMITKYDDNLQDIVLEEKHLQLNIQSINERLYNRLQRSWDHFAIKEEETYNRSLNENNDMFRDHNWWRRAGLKCIEDPPVPFYT